MVEHKEHFHGSDLEKIEQVYGVKKEDLISFAANVNPLGLSHKLKKTLSEHLDVLTSYPDREYTALRTTIADYCNTVKEHVVVGNGSTELISLFIEAIAPKNALIIAPTYSEYEREITIAGGTSHYFELKECNNFVLCMDDLKQELTHTYDLLVICNPNNPTSSAFTRDELKQIVLFCQTKKISVLVDETYIEFAENYDSINGISLTEEFDNLFIIRGISKFFAAPGLRLGYAITGNEQYIKTINEKKNPWTINSLAEIAGKLMFTDEDYIRETKNLIFSERKRICSRLSKITGLKYYEPSANFILVRLLSSTVDSDSMFDLAIRQNMMIRNCATFPFLDEHYIRFCIMMPDQNDRLLNCIETALS